jgi:O-antigen biosynthesis protein
MFKGMRTIFKKFVDRDQLQSSDQLANLSPRKTQVSNISLSSFVTESGLTARRAVVMLLESFDVGGLEKVVFDMSLQMRDKGLQIIILVVGKGGVLSDRARSSGLQVLQFNGDRSKLEIAIDEINPRVAICHHSYSGHQAFSRNGSLIIEIMQNVYHWQRNSDDFINFRKLNYLTIACSKTVEKYAIDCLNVDPDRLQVIHNGFDSTGLVRPNLDEIKRRRTESLNTVFLMTAHIWANKCHNGMLTAFGQIHSKFPNTRLLFDGAVGHDDVGLRLRTRIDELGLANVVTIKNSPDRQSISQSYSDSHVFILPSIVEGFSIATLEAMYFGMPLILTDSGGAAEILSHELGDKNIGILIDSPVCADEVSPEAVDRIGRLDEPPHLSNLIQAMTDMLLDRDNWIKRGLHGTTIVQHYSIEKTIESYMGLIADKL